MFQGTTTKLSDGSLASAATIYPKTDIVRLTGSTAIANIVPTFTAGHSGVVFLVPVSGNLGLLNSGNIAVAVTIAQNRVCTLVYSRVTGKWHPGAIS